MRDTTSQAAAPSAQTLRLFLWLRIMLLVLVVGAGIMIVQLGARPYPVAPLYALLGLSALLGAVLHAGVKMGASPSSGLWSLLAGDVAIATATLHYSGGVTSQFSLIYCLPIIAAAFLLRVPGGLILALLASLSYGGYGFLQGRGIVTPPWGGEDMVASAELLQTYMHVSLFFMVGAIGGYLAERMQLKGQQLQSAKTELEQLRVDTDNILKHMSSGVLVIGSDGTIITANRAAERILEFDRADVEGMKAHAVFESLMPEFAGELLGALRADESRSRIQMEIKRKGGRSLPIGVSVSVLRDDDDKKRGIIAVFQDLTEVRDMQERVRKADRLAAIGELSAGIAHEIRNPLASISGSIEILYNELRLSGENRRLMELVMKESDRLDRIITDFLDFARMRPPTWDDIDVATMIDDVVVLIRNNPSLAGGVNVEVELDGNAVVRVDEEQMRQVFLNLAINACEAMPKGGTLTVRAVVTGDGGLRVSFRDEGEGIDGQARSRLFEPFFTTKEGGTGLGLAIANKIVESHGGSMSAHNCDGGGAEFFVALPPSVVRRSAVTV